MYVISFPTGLGGRDMIHYTVHTTVALPDKAKLRISYGAVKPSQSSSTVTFTEHIFQDLGQQNDLTFCEDVMFTQRCPGTEDVIRDGCSGNIILSLKKLNRFD
jgi:hypothetical protein